MLRTVAARLMRAEVAAGPHGARWYAAPANQMALIKSLRESSGAPISDVKAALQAADWDLELATTELRKKGIASAGKKAARSAAEGLVGLASGPAGVAVVEINCETDFVPRNDAFKALVQQAAAAAARLPASGAADGSLTSASVLAASTAQGSSVDDALTGVAGTVRENIRLRRAFLLPTPAGGVVGSYLHQSSGEGLGQIAGLVALGPETQGAALEGAAATQAADLARKLGMQVVASAPKFLDRSAVTAEDLKAEEDILREQAKSSGKPAAIIDKMVAGRMHKYYQEVCLLEQAFVMDDSRKVQDVVKDLGKELGTPLRISGFLRVKVGEGVEKKETDFAAEVASTLKETAST